MAVLPSLSSMDFNTISSLLLNTELECKALSHLLPLPEKSKHLQYLKEFRTKQCRSFIEHKCHNHRPYTCFNWHFPNQMRRQPYKRSDGTFNYNPDVYCTKYDENSGICSDGEECPYVHRNAGDTERRYHPRYFKTGICIYETTPAGHCSKNGIHCAFAHGMEDVRNPVYDIREIQNPSEHNINLPASLEKERVLSEDPKWNDMLHVLAHYKTELCKKPPRMCRQGYACPFYHNGKDKRRNPAESRYRSAPCPIVKPGDEWLDSGLCDKLDSCLYCHTRTEQQFHPEIYKSTKCNDMLHSAYCPRGPFCAFAHEENEMTIGRDFLTNVGNNNLMDLSDGNDANNIGNVNIGSPTVSFNGIITNGKKTIMKLDFGLDLPSTTTTTTTNRSSEPVKSLFEPLHVTVDSMNIMNANGENKYLNRSNAYHHNASVAGNSIHPLLKPMPILNHQAFASPLDPSALLLHPNTLFNTLAASPAAIQRHSSPLQMGTTPTFYSPAAAAAAAMVTHHQKQQQQQQQPDASTMMDNLHSTLIQNSLLFSKLIPKKFWQSSNISSSSSPCATLSSSSSTNYPSVATTTTSASSSSSMPSSSVAAAAAGGTGIGRGINCSISRPGNLTTIPRPSYFPSTISSSSTSLSSTNALQSQQQSIHSLLTNNNLDHGNHQTLQQRLYNLDDNNDFSSHHHQYNNLSNYMGINRGVGIGIGGTNGGDIDKLLSSSSSSKQPSYHHQNNHHHQHHLARNTPNAMQNAASNMSSILGNALDDSYNFSNMDLSQLDNLPEEEFADEPPFQFYSCMSPSNYYDYSILDKNTAMDGNGGGSGRGGGGGGNRTPIGGQQHVDGSEPMAIPPGGIHHFNDHQFVLGLDDSPSCHDYDDSSFPNSCSSNLTDNHISSTPDKGTCLLLNGGGGGGAHHHQNNATSRPLRLGMGNRSSYSTLDYASPASSGLGGSLTHVYRNSLTTPGSVRLDQLSETSGGFSTSHIDCSSTAFSPIETDSVGNLAPSPLFDMTAFTNPASDIEHIQLQKKLEEYKQKLTMTTAELESTKRERDLALVKLQESSRMLHSLAISPEENTSPPCNTLAINNNNNNSVTTNSTTSIDAHETDLLLQTLTKDRLERMIDSLNRLGMSYDTQPLCSGQNMSKSLNNLHNISYLTNGITDDEEDVDDDDDDDAAAAVLCNSSTTTSCFLSSAPATTNNVFCSQSLH